MPTPSEHKTVQSRILAYAEVIGWTIVSREEAEERRGGIPAPLRRKDGDSRKDGDRNVPAPLSLFFDDLLDAQLLTFNPCYAEAEGALPGQFRHLHTVIHGNREFLLRSGLNCRERRDRKEFVDGSIGPEAAAKLPGWEFWRRLFRNLATGCRPILEQAVQEMNQAPETP